MPKANPKRTRFWIIIMPDGRISPSCGLTRKDAWESYHYLYADSPYSEAVSVAQAKREGYRAIRARLEE